MRQKYGVAPDEKLIIYVGRFVEAKGMRELLTAFKAMSDQDAKVGLVLVGDGVMKTELLDSAAGIARACSRTGWTST